MTMRSSRKAATGFMADFQKFILRGNVVDLAVAVVIGAAFGAIITSFVGDIITPLILNPAMQAAGVDKLSELSAGGIQYGLFLAAVLNFIVISFCLFLIIRSFEGAKKRMQRQEELAAAEEETPDPAIVTQEHLIRAVEHLTAVLERQS